MKSGREEHLLQKHIQLLVFFHHGRIPYSAHLICHVHFESEINFKSHNNLRENVLRGTIQKEPTIPVKLTFLNTWLDKC
jgi:hypothetical protein